MEYYLKIGEIKLGTKDDILRTILGSCIGLCLWDKKKHIGGMVHIMLPTPPEKNCSENKGKYATTAVPTILNAMLKKKSQKSDLVAKIFGGASMFAKLESKNANNIGERNYSITYNLVKELHIPIVAEDVKGTMGRSITLNCSTGIVLVKTSKGIIEK